jgi:hypothetical protein
MTLNITGIPWPPQQTILQKLSADYPLRGVAVLLGVLFHLSIDGFDGGFLGVDVFFVVSGYLMALMYDPTRKNSFFIKRKKTSP